MRCIRRVGGVRRYGEVEFRPRPGGITVNEPDETAVPDPLSLACYSQSLLHLRKSGILTTADMTGTPIGDNPPLYGGVMPYIVMKNKQPIIGLHESEQHYRNIEMSPQASLLLYPLTPKKFNPSHFGLPSVNLVGKVQPLILDADLPEDSVAVHFCAKFPQAQSYVKDYIWMELEIDQVVVHEAGVEKGTKVMPEAFFAAGVDMVMAESAPFLEELNQLYVPGMRSLCKEYGGKDVDELFAYHVDSRSLHVYANDIATNEWNIYQFPFPSEFTSLSECRKGLLGTLSQSGPSFS